MIQREYRFADCIFALAIQPGLDRNGIAWAVVRLLDLDRGTLAPAQRLNIYGGDAACGGYLQALAQRNSGNLALWRERWASVVTAVADDPEVAAAQGFGGGPAEEWPDPLPFPEVEVPEFPAEVFPGGYAEYLRSQSWETQVPMDLTGVLMLGALAGAAQGKCDLQLHLGWREQLSLDLVYCIMYSFTYGLWCGIPMAWHEEARHWR